MLNKWKPLYGGIAVAVAALTGAYFTLNDVKPTAVKVRTAQLEIPPQYTTLVETLFNENTSLDGNDDRVYFYGENRTESGGSNEDEGETASGGFTPKVTYECTFTTQSLTFQFTISEETEGGTIETESETTEGIIDGYGGLDAAVEIEGQTYYISDYKEIEALDELLLNAQTQVDNLGWGWLAAALAAVVVTIYVVVSQTAEQIRADSNYTYNQRMERAGNGVGLGNYITDQSEKNRPGYNSGDYRFGFTTFEDVGCEVAAAYNAMIAMDAEELLSETIYKFEKWAIEISVGWGSLGSNPRQINKYLDKRGFSYEKYTSFSSFESAVNNAPDGAHIIMSRWNKPIYKGLHTFYIQKITNNLYYSYNWDYADHYIDKTSISTFNDGSGFIVGYIING